MHSGAFVMNASCQALLFILTLLASTWFVVYFFLELNPLGFCGKRLIVELDFNEEFLGFRI